MRHKGYKYIQDMAKNYGKKFTEGDDTGEEARRLIKKLSDAGMTNSQIGEKVDRSAGTISRILNGEIENPPQSLIDKLKEIDSN